MTSTSKTVAVKVAKTIAVTFALFAIVYVGWFLYAVLVMRPNEANSTLIGIVGISLMGLLAVSTVAMSRSVWMRSSGHRTSSRRFWIYTPFMVIFPVLVSPLSPTTLIFVIFAIVLLFLNSALGRSFVAVSAK
ncbi:MAG: hypothetical protein HOF01_08875 [Chloroflexi bacterium]|nr:hypothetical protein [Chloroflexota bacterium]